MGQTGLQCILVPEKVKSEHEHNIQLVSGCSCCSCKISLFSFPDLSCLFNNQSRSYFPFVLSFFCPDFKSGTFIVRLESEASVLPAASVASRHILTTGSSSVEKVPSRRRRSFAGINEDLRWITAVVVNCRSGFLDSSQQGDLVGRRVSQGETESD